METSNGAAIRDLRNSVFKWLQSDEAFIDELNRRRKEETKGVQGQLQNLATEALQIVQEMMTSPHVPADVRLNAALAVISAVSQMPQGDAAGAEPERPSLSSLEEALESSLQATRQARAAGRR